jgi:hypothetical protein
MDLKEVKTRELIECYQIILNYLKELNGQKENVEKSESNEGKN